MSTTTSAGTPAGGNHGTEAPAEPTVRRAPNSAKTTARTTTRTTTRSDAPKGRRAGKRSTRRSAAKDTHQNGSGVNLLSPWVFEQLRVHQMRHRFLAAGLVLVAVIALVWTGLRFNLHRAEEQLRGEEAVGRGLTQQASTLAPVRLYVDGVQRRVATGRLATQDDVAFSTMLDGLGAALPPGAAVTSLTVDLVTVEGADGAVWVDDPEDPAHGLIATGCPGPDPFATTTAIACVTVQGTATSREVVSDLVVALDESGLFVDPFIDTTTTGDAVQVDFSGSFGLSPKAFSRRYDSLGDELTKGAEQ
ncbi:PilN domain-containing protein [Nocardioides sp. YIM 152588]|uniref:PilN domain-containing protein n=1 Tax=Nocardioides sp. YIM 152588 TaxID=3158259 RepID=UPI0032E4D739